MPDPIAKSLARLSRERLVDLCISWAKSSKCHPYLTSNRNTTEVEEEDYLHEPVCSRTELKLLYEAARQGDVHGELANLSKKDIIDRIIDGDWRRGLSYHQLASIDFAKLEEDDAFLRWSALKLVPLEDDCSEATRKHSAKRRRLEHPSTTQPRRPYPETTPSLFVQNLKTHISPLVKADYHVHRIERLRLNIVRLHLQKQIPFAPLSTNVPRHRRSAVEPARSMFIALPDSCHFVYVSASGSVTAGVQKTTCKRSHAEMDLFTIKKIVVEAIPKALSRPQQRWSLEPTQLTARSLRTMCLLRGSGKVGTTGGPFSHLTQSVREGEPWLKGGRPDDEEDVALLPDAARKLQGRLELIERRFGQLSGPCHASLDRLHVRVSSLTQSPRSSGKKRKHNDHEGAHESAPMTITLFGSDVFAGLKQLAMSHPEYVDMKRLPAAFSGEGNRSIMTI